MSMQKANVETRIVYSLRIHTQLLIRGIQPLCSMPNPPNERYLCWIYANDDEFVKAFDEIVTEVEAQDE